jgi:gas vesicle protein
MHYDDTTRRFNLMRGLMVGAVLGAGLALLLAPSDKAFARKSRKLARGAEKKLDKLRHRSDEPKSARGEGAPRRKFEL